MIIENYKITDVRIINFDNPVSLQVNIILNDEFILSIKLYFKLYFISTPIPASEGQQKFHDYFSNNENLKKLTNYLKIDKILYREELIPFFKKLKIDCKIS